MNLSGGETTAGLPIATEPPSNDPRFNLIADDAKSARNLALKPDGRGNVNTFSDSTYNRAGLS